MGFELGGVQFLTDLDLETIVWTNRINGRQNLSEQNVPVGIRRFEH